MDKIKLKKKWMIAIISIVLLAANQMLYLTVVQFKCTDKIDSGRDLNLYEKLSAYQTHTNLWLFGWVIEPNTAELCFCKQFHIKQPIHLYNLPKEDSYLKSVRANYTKPVRLAWKSYSSKASIYLNGSTVTKHYDEEGGYEYYEYSIPADYSPGIIQIKGITISETVLDYLEQKGWLCVFNTIRIDQETNRGK